MNHSLGRALILFSSHCLSQSTLLEKPPVKKTQARSTAGCRKEAHSLLRQCREITSSWKDLSTQVTTCRHQLHTSHQTTSTFRNSHSERWRERNMWLSWTDRVLIFCNIRSIFHFFNTILKSDRYCRPFCPRTWASSKALFLKHGLFTLLAPATSSVSKFPVLTGVNFHFCKSQAATCFWEVNKPSEKC